MLRFIAKRLTSGFLLLLVISTLTYFLLFFSSSSVARNLLGDSATSAQVVAKAHELGLDRPLLPRYFEWLGHALTGDLGISWYSNQPIVSSLASRLPVTMTIVLFAILLASTLATVLGMLAAVKGGWIDRLVQFLAIAGFAVPNFVVAIILVTVFAINIAIFPATGWVNLSDDPRSWFLSLVLPVAALVVSTVASAAQQIRSAFKDVLSRDWVRTLRSRGIKNNEIL
jgi:peptide/nickel transport system permease protein